MDQYVTVNRIGNAVVVRFAASWWFNDVTICELRRDLVNLVETTDAKAVVLNLATVDDSGAAGIHMLIRIQKQALAKGIALRLSNLQPRLEEHIRIAQLDKFFVIDHDEAEALAAVANMDQRGGQKARP